LTNGFIGEFLILLGGFQANRIITAVAVLGVILGSVYMLWAVKRMFFGEVAGVVKDHADEGLEMGTREMIVMAPLVLLIFWMGIFPSDFLNWSKASLDHFIENRTHYELNLDESL